MPARLSDLPGAPAPVRRFQRAYSAASRGAILHELLTRGPAQRVDLVARLGITAPPVRKALVELVEAGYVTFRLPAQSSATSQEQPHGTLYTANREQVMSDLAATMAWFSEERR